MKQIIKTSGKAVVKGNNKSNSFESRIGRQIIDSRQTLRSIGVLGSFLLTNSERGLTFILLEVSNVEKQRLMEYYNISSDDYDDDALSRKQSIPNKVRHKPNYFG